MVLTNSIFRGFLDGLARTMAEHGGLVTGDGKRRQVDYRKLTRMAAAARRKKRL